MVPVHGMPRHSYPRSAPRRYPTIHQNWRPVAIDAGEERRGEERRNKNQVKPV